MSWQGYVDNLMANPFMMDAALCGFASGQESVWASSPGYASISAAEIKRLTGNRSDFAQNGPHIAGQKCRMLRDNMDDDHMCTLNLKTAADAAGKTYNVCVGKSKQALVIARGKEDANGGQVASTVFNMVDYLKKLNY